MDEQPREDNKKSVSLTLASDDIKLLVITFAGTVAANIVTVLLVGLAIAVTHALKASSSLPLHLYVILSLVTIGSITAPTYALVTLSRDRHREDKIFEGSSKKILITLCITAMFGTLLCVLIWVGIASGIKWARLTLSRGSLVLR